MSQVYKVYEIQETGGVERMNCPICHNEPVIEKVIKFSEENAREVFIKYLQEKGGMMSDKIIIEAKDKKTWEIMWFDVTWGNMRSGTGCGSGYIGMLPLGTHRIARLNGDNRIGCDPDEYELRVVNLKTPKTDKDCDGECGNCEFFINGEYPDFCWKKGE